MWFFLIPKEVSWYNMVDLACVEKRALGISEYFDIVLNKNSLWKEAQVSWIFNFYKLWETSDV